MKKLFIKDKKLRNKIEINNIKYFLLKSIIKNSYIFILLRFQAYLKLKIIISPISIVNRCILSYNKKRFNKLSLYSRQFFLKKIQNGQIFGIENLSW